MAVVASKANQAADKAIAAKAKADAATLAAQHKADKATAAKAAKASKASKAAPVAPATPTGQPAGWAPAYSNTAFVRYARKLRNGNYSTAYRVGAAATPADKALVASWGTLPVGTVFVFVNHADNSAVPFGSWAPCYAYSTAVANGGALAPSTVASLGKAGVAAVGTLPGGLTATATQPAPATTAPADTAQPAPAETAPAPKASKAKAPKATPAKGTAPKGTARKAPAGKAVASS